MDRSMDQTEDRPQERQLTACVRVWKPSAGHHWADRRSRLLPLLLHKQTFFFPLYTRYQEYLVLPDHYSLTDFKDWPRPLLRGM